MISPSTVLFVLAGIFSIAAIASWIKERRLASMPYFDMPIRDAISHIVETSTYDFTSSYASDQSAFEELYREMCSGKLLIVGSWGSDSPRKRIGPRKCKRFAPRRVVIPRTCDSPDGYRFDLIEELEVAPLVEHDKPTGFTRLRVRSRDLYKIWPRNKRDG